MVGVFVVYLAVLYIFVLRVDGGLTCPKGIASFSHGVRSNSYYACTESNGQPVLMSCGHGKFYWAYKKACYDIQNFENAGKTENTDLKIYSRRILGDLVFLGDLYNANTGEVLTGYSFWSADTILKKKKRRLSPSSSVDIFSSRSTIDRLDRSGFRSALKLDVMGDLIRIERSAAYLNERLESENEVAVILRYQATTQAETIPVSTPKDFDYCSENGATHVITSITNGIGANFVYKKSIGEGESRDEVERNLKIAVDAVPNTKSDTTDSITQTINDVRVKFFADFVSKKQPTSYQDTIQMYQSLADRVGNNTVARQVHLMPMTKFCEGKRITHIAVANDILNSVNEMLDEIEKVKLMIKTLKMETAVRNYEPLMVILETLSKELTRFELQTKTELEDILPRIRRGNTTEEELILLLNKYEKSAFRYDNVKSFLHNRRREINMLNYILNPQKFQETNIRVVSYDEASDIQTMFIKPFVLMLRYNILPSVNIVQKFLKGEQKDESKYWYNNPYVISAMGIQFNKFVQFSSANKNLKTRGYLLAISDAKHGVSNDVVGDVININAQKEGLMYTFKFPSIPQKMISSSNTHHSMSFMVTRPISTWVTGYTISYWLPEKQKEVTSNTYQFFKNVTTVLVDKLLPNKLYDFTLQYATPMGVSPPGAITSWYTRPCSPPENLRVTTLAANYFIMDWDVPLSCGKRVQIAKYRVIVTGEDKFSKTIIVEGETSVLVKRLQAASNFVVSIEAIAGKQMFNGTQKNVILTTLPSTITFITLPEAPSHLSLLNRSIHSAIVQWVAPIKVASGAVIEKYRMKYTITNNIGNVSERGTEMEITSLNTSCRLTGLIQGTTYAVSVQVLTSKGDSDYSTNLLISTMFVKSEIDLLRDSVNHSVVAIESEMAKRKEDVDDTIKSLSNIQSLMVFYPRLRSSGPLTNSISGCAGTINTAGELRYPSGTEFSYYDDCTWNIQTGLPTTLQPTRWDLDSVGHYISIYDDELLIKKADYRSPGTLHTRSGNVRMRFHSDNQCTGHHGIKITISVTDTKRMAAQRYYPKFNATFTGYGSPKSYSEHHTWNLPKTNSSIPSCIQDCNERFLSDKTWSEMSIDMKSEPLECSCYKNPVGFEYSLSRFQFRML